MSKLRFLAAMFASAGCALALSVGAAMAEEHTAKAAATTATTKAGKSTTTPSGVCILHDLKLKR